MGRLSVDTYAELQEERKAVGSVAGEMGVGRPDVTSGYSRFTKNFIETNADIMASFKGNLTSTININGLLGTNIRRQKIDQIFESTNNGLSVPGVYALSNSVDPMQPPEELLARIGLNGYFGSVSLGFNNMFYLDGTYRIDQSSTLPKDSWTYGYPSISGSFLFSEVLQRDWLSLGKLRLNYAEVGNSAPFASVLDTYVPVAPFTGNPLASVANTKNNPDLKPERTKSLEAGLEMNFLSNRVGFDLAFYKSNTVDQILPVSVSYITGYAFKYVNAGELQNKGVELRVNGTPVKTSDFQWDIILNFTRNRNEVVSLEEGIENLQIAALQGGVSINARVGEPYGTIQGTDYVYLNGQRVVGEDGYYLFTPTSDQVIGNINPDWLGGIQNVLTYKSLSLSFLVDMQQGGSVFSLDQSYGGATGLYPETVYTNDLGNPVRSPVLGNLEDGYDPASGGLIVEGVLEDGTPNQQRVEGGDYVAFGYLANPNRAFVYDASFVKLREVVLTYNFPTAWVSKASLAGASLSFVGSNLWIIDKNLPYADPEASQSSGNVQGWQSGVMPAIKNYGFSLKLQF
jgi:outer membrane receptor protein involved in Fe transport